jgi:hypothetical protein
MGRTDIVGPECKPDGAKVVGKSLSNAGDEKSCNRPLSKAFYVIYIIPKMVYLQREMPK